jgi:uncharacterized protein YoxC
MIDRHGVVTPVASWGSIFGGAVTVIAVSILLSLLGAGLGFGAVDPQSNHPIGGIGVGFGIWSVLSLFISLAAGGFVAGYLSLQAGWVHGLLSWATALIAAVVLSAFAISGAAQLAGSAIGSVASLTGSAISTTAGLGGDAISAVVSNFDEDQFADVDAEGAAADIRELLQDTDIEALQPEAISEELQGARADVADAFEALRSNPTEYAAVLENLANDLQTRLEGFGEEIDRNAIVASLTENTDMTQQEAEQATDQAIARYEEFSTSVREQVDAAVQSVQGLGTEIEQLEAQAREQAAQAADAISSASLWAFLACLIGAGISAVAGFGGARTRELMEL